MTPFDLRPLTLGEILDRTFSLYRRNFLLFLGICGIPHLLSLALGLIQTFSFQFPAIGSGQTPRAIIMPWDRGPAWVVFWLLTVIIGIIVYLLSQGATVLAVSEIYLGRATSIAASLRRTWSDVLSLFGVVVLNGLATTVAFIALFVPGVYVACRLLVCVPAALIEGRGPRESLSRSWDLTRGAAGRSFVLFLLYFALVLGIGLLVGAPLGTAIAASRNNPEMLRIYTALDQVFSTVVDVLVTPVILIGASVFYFDLRVRKEAFDLQFMMDPNSERTARGGGSVPSILS